MRARALLLVVAGCGSTAAPVDGGIDAAADGATLPDAAAPDAGWCRPPLATPLPDIGWSAGGVLPTYRTGYVAAAARDGRIAFVWNAQSPDPRVSDPDEAFLDGKPTAYAALFDPASNAAVGAPAVVGVPPFPEAASCLGLPDDPPHYNTNHNTPLVLATPSGGFLSLALPMNANGYAQCQPSERLYHYMSSENGAGSATWSNPALAVGRNPAVGVTLHEYMGTIAGDGTVHLFGQWQLGAESGGFGYLRRRPGDALWDSFGVAAAYRPPGLIYFAAGVGYVPPVRNAQGSFDVHLAFEWNKQGDYPRYGLHYLVSHDGGATFGSVDGSVQYDFGARGSLGPAEADSTSVAVIPAALGGASYSGGQPASELGLALGATLDGQPVILRLDCQAADCAGGAAQLGTTQARVWTYLPPSRSWVAVPVGPPLNFYALGAGLAVRGDTGNVNVVLLDNGFAADGTKHPPQVLQLVESIDDLRAGKSTWTSRVVRTIQTTSYADALRVTVVPDCRFEILVDGSDSYQLVPEFLESAIE